MNNHATISDEALDDYLTVVEVAAKFGVTKAAVKHWIKNDLLPATLMKVRWYPEPIWMIHKSDASLFTRPPAGPRPRHSSRPRARTLRSR